MDVPCGKGILEDGEECDAGAANADSAACTSDCRLARCGDGLIWAANETCDDGNSDETDACTTLCRAPSCTDGLLSGDEPSVDCGGSCAATCALGEACGVGATSRFRTQGTATVCDTGPCDVDIVLFHDGVTCAYQSNANSTACNTAFYDVDLAMPSSCGVNACDWHYGLTSNDCGGASCMELVTNHDGNHIAVGSYGNTERSFDLIAGENPNLYIWVR